MEKREGWEDRVETRKDDGRIDEKEGEKIGG